MAYYHYTSRERAQAIICAGRIDPGPSGKIYLSTEIYVSGQQAANDLAITSKPVEVFVVIPDHPLIPSLSAVTLVSPIIAAPIGMPLRRGGGGEVSCPGPIAIIEDKWLSVREP